MRIDIKYNLMPLLFATGDIDNRKKTIPKNLIEKQCELESGILKEYNIQNKKIELTTKIENKTIKFAEMIPLKKDKENMLIKCIVLIEAVDDITEDIMRTHLAELKLYSYLYMKENNIDTVHTILVFEDVEYRNRTEKIFTFSYEEIENFFIENIKKYIKWEELTEKWIVDRNKSIKPLKFPFKNYRAGQEKLARGIYTTISQGKMLFTQSPTGIGKTVSACFPSIKIMGEEKIDKIFYLTAKTMGAKVAEESFEKMKEQGLKFRNITLTAKDKVCFKGKAKCNPVACEYAKNYYGKINDVIFQMLSEDATFNRQTIEEYARKYKVCPFELSLDLSLYSDAIICDYNYVFDPNVYLKRYFEEGKKCNCVFLIDEAHNLVDRARSMYSAEIDTKLLTNALDSCEGDFEKVREIILNVLKILSSYESKCVKSQYSSKTFPSDLANTIAKLTDTLSALFHRSKNSNSDDFDKLSELYTACNQFVNISELYDECYVFYLEQNESTKFKLFCIDPSSNLRKGYDKGRSSIIFSATLSPLGYFRDILGGDKDSYGVVLESPFDVNNREIIVVDNISTKYKDRENSYDKIVEQINAMISCKMGNYMIFLPSFDYMNKVKDRFNEKYPDVYTISQDSLMSELEREIYLYEFSDNPTKTMVSFNVISGIFGEGIDFKGNKLIGTMIVGVGLPMICLERDVIKNHFQQKNGYGFDFAYTYPGINKVVQAAGRVIRTDEDKGVIILIDDRFGTQKYKNLFPKEWNKRCVSRSSNDTKAIVDKFWSTNL